MSIDLNQNAKRWPDECARLLSASPVVIYACGPGPNYPTRFINENVATQFGYRPEEFYERRSFWTERIHPDDADRVLRELSRIDKGKRLSYEYRFRHKDGRFLWLHDELTPLKDADGKVVGLVGSWFDVSQRKQAEEALEIKDRAIASSITAVAFAEFGGNLTYVNQAFLDLWGYADDQEVLGRPPRDFWEAPERAREVVEALRSRGSWVGELVAKRKDGSLFDAQVSASMVKDEAGKPVQMMSSFLDISQRKQAEETLRGEQQLLQLLMDNIPDNIYFKDRESRFTRVNRALARFLGGDRPDELVGKRDADFYPPAAADRFCADEQGIIETGEPIIGKVEQAGYDDVGPRWFSTTKVPLRNTAGEIVGIVGVSRDVTERERAEEALRAARENLERRVEERTAELAHANEALQDSRERLRSLVETTSDWIWEVDRSERYTYASPKVRELLGYEPADVIGKTPFELMPPEEAERVRTLFREVAASRRPFRGLENLNLHKDGHPVLLETSGVPILDADGALLGYRGIDRDITERKRADEALRESEHRYRAIVEDQTEFVCRWQPGFTYTFVNDAYCRCFGKSCEELIGQSFMQFIPEDQHPKVLQDFASLCRENPVATHEHRVRDASGEIRWHQWTNRALFDENGEIIEYQSVGRDVTEQKQAHEALQQSERRYRAIVEDQTELICRWVSGYRHTFVNDAYCRCFGKSHEELTGQSLMSLIPEEDHPKASEHFASLCREDPVATHEHRVIAAGGEIRWHEWTDRAIFDEHDRIVEYQSVGRDVTEHRQAEEALRESKEELQAIYDGAVYGMLISDNQTHAFLRANAAMCDMLGRSERELLSTSVADLVPAYHRAQAAADLAAAAEGKQNSWTNVPMLRKNGEVFFVDIGTRLISYKGRRCTIGFFKDITERKRAEEALRESERKSRAILDHTFQFIGLMTPDGTLVEANRSALDFAGIEESDVLGKPFWETPWWTHSSELQDRLRDAVGEAAAGHFVRFEATHPATDGMLHSVDFSLKPVKDEAGNVDLLIPEGRDITERKWAEEALKESEELFRTVVNASKDAMVAINRDGLVTIFNPAAEEMFGRKTDEVIGQPLDCLMPEQYRAPHRQYVEQYFRAGVPRQAMGRTLELPAVRKDGTEFPIELSLSAGQRGDRPFVLAVIRDITERKRAEDALRKQTEILENVLAHIPHSVFWKDTKSLYLGCNENFAREAGLATPEQIVGKTDYDLPWSREQTEFYLQCDREVTTADRPLVNIEEPQRRADGSQAIVMTSKTPLRDRNGKVIGVLGIYADITERKRAEETLRRQALVFDNMYDGVIVTDTEGRITDWNPGAERIFGYTKAEILGQSPETLDRPQDAAALTASIGAGLAREGRWSGEFHIVRKDGSERICEGVVVRLSDQEGLELGRVSVNRDITDRMRAEEEVHRRQEELAHVTRLATMGEMATGLAHELNQPLSAILYYARGCERRLRAGGWDVDEVLGAIDKVASQADRAAVFIDRLRTFLRKGGPNLASIDLNRVVREAVDFVEHDVQANDVSIDFQLSTALRPVLADMMQIEQVVLNLVRNGIESMRETEPAERRLILQTSGAGSEAITVAVADNGCGCSDEVAERLFDAFFTTKPNGIGMGLAVSRSIIEAHGGRLWPTPNPNGGMTFRFTLPVAAGGPIS